jgi:hypothetical protein
MRGAVQVSELSGLVLDVVGANTNLEAPVRLCGARAGGAVDGK